MVHLDKSALKEKIDQLENLVKRMDVPVHHRRNIKWINKNLSVRNGSHPKFKEAMELVEQLVSHGVSTG